MATVRRSNRRTIGVKKINYATPNLNKIKKEKPNTKVSGKTAKFGKK